MEASVANVCYTNKNYVIWKKEPHATGYEIYKNGSLIATNVKSEDEDATELLVKLEPPTVFDHGKHTNLFRNDLTKLLCYEDEDIKRYTEYYYKVIAITPTGNIESDDIIITTG